MDREWVLHVMETVSGFSRGETGITRLALSPEEMQAREYVSGLMQELGMTIRVDAIGNIIGRLAGTDPAAAPVIVGSHLDSVPEGGRYDGVLGVIAGLAAIRRIVKEGTTKHPLELIIFTAEESSRFGFATMGSKAMAGVADLVAGLAGILVPVTLDRFDIDPAVSSAVFVTTLTDIMGFFSFLGLAVLSGLTAMG